MSVSRQKKQQLFPGGMQGPAASTASRKSNQAITQSKSKYGGPRATAYASSRTNILSSASRKSLVPGGQSERSTISKPPVQVFDETGQDVTPQPLLDPNALKKTQSNLLGEGSVGTPTDLMSQTSIYNTGTATASTFGGGPFSRSVFSQSYDTGSDSMTDDIVDPSAELASAWTDIRHHREELKENLEESDLEKSVDLNLTETNTIWLLDMPGVCMSLESDEADVVKNSNEKYQELMKSRVGNDRYMDRGMNTFNEPPKVKAIQTQKISTNEVCVMATNWDMYDTYREKELEENAAEGSDDEDTEVVTSSRPGSNTKTSDPADKDGSALKDDKSNKGLGASRPDSRSSDRSGTGMSSVPSESIFTSKESGVTSMVSTESQNQVEDLVFNSEEFKRDLFIMERVINLNSYQPKQASYRNYPIVPDIDKEMPDLAPTGQLKVSDMGPNFDRLWAYSSPLTKGRNVSCMSWNRLNPDLIAVAYGQFDFTNQKPGLVCCWSLKNPEFPERVYTSDVGITTVDFSLANPNLLAVGFYDGGVAIYNVRSIVDEPILDNFNTSGKHTAPVWQVRWVEKERGSGEETAEVLVSISTDGRVTQWSIRKGFECNDLMRLKRVPIKMSTKGREKKGEAFISRHAGGMSFDFHPRDSNMYLVGTEEGHIHKCSCSYNEQYLDSYSGHTAPVYKIEWSPFAQDIFLSTSADWSIRLWHQDRQSPILSFFSSTKSVYDVTWSPRSSTVFSCVNEGSVEVWDLSISTLDPIIVNSPTSGAKQTAVTFARNSECILVGDGEGQVTVYQLRCMPEPPTNQADALTNVIKASLASQLQNDSKAAQNKESEYAFPSLDGGVD